MNTAETCFTHQMKKGLFQLGQTAKWKNSNLVDFDSALKEISIFDDTNETNPTSALKRPGRDGDADDRERPVTPINDSIQVSPDSFDVLSKEIRRRLQPRPNWKHLKEQEQINMAAIILGEAYCRWGTFLSLADDPFLSKQLNKEVRRRISVQIVLVCEKLFLFHASNIKLLNMRGVYSNTTNITRTYTQLALDMDKFLNVLAIRRRMLVNLRNELSIGYKPGVVNNDVDILRKIDPVVAIAPSAPRNLSFGSLIKTTGTGGKKNAEYNMEREIRDITRSIKPINFEKTQLFAMMPKRLPLAVAVDDGDGTDVSNSGSNYTVSSETAARERKLLMNIALKKCPSEPNLATVKLVDELPQMRVKPSEKMKLKAEVDESLRREELAMLNLIKLHTCKSIDSSLHLVDWDEKLHLREKEKESLESTSTGISPDPDDRTRELGDDLVKVTRRLGRSKVPGADEREEDEETQLPPLITAITRLQRQDKKLKLMKVENEELDRRAYEASNAARDAIPRPACPQPPVIQTTMPVSNTGTRKSEEIMIRIADVIMPTNIEFPKHRLHLQQPLYNILTGEISNEMARDLDKNLCDDKELQEVFNEIMDTVDNNHLLHDNDTHVIEPAQNVDLNRAMASATLSLPPSQQIINPNLVIASRHDRLNQLFTVPGGENDDNKPPTNDEASWLAWWKSTITSDDFLKYISTQETDYLNVVFHFYDSEVGSVVTASSETSEDKYQIEADKKKDMMNKVIAEKRATWLDMWNVKTVSLGGLGHFPDSFESDDPSSEVVGALSEKSEVASNAGTQVEVEATDVVAVLDAEREGSPVKEVEVSAPTEAREETAEALPVVEGEQTAPSHDEAIQDQQEGSAPDDDVAVRTKVPNKVIKYKEEATEKQEGGGGQVKGHEKRVASAQISRQVSHADQSRPVRRRPASSSSSSSDADEYIGNEAEIVKRAKHIHWMRHLFAGRRTTIPQLKKANVAPGEETGRRASNSTRILMDYFGNYLGERSNEDDDMGPLKSSGRTQDREMQRRLRVVWQRLHMSDGEVMDIIAKFTSDPHDHSIRSKVEAWEQTAQAIYARESVLAELEAFERFASDPNRFFHKNSSNSVRRMNEARRRSRIYDKLYKLEKRARRLVTMMKKRFGFEVKYAGRNYSEKMGRDKTEMLYWLQQERRCVIMGKQGLTLNRLLTNTTLQYQSLQTHPSTTAVRNLPKIDFI